MAQREYAYDKIRSAITYSKRKPGERLVENRLRKVLKVARTLLREALRQLQIEGHIDYYPDREATIKKISLEDVQSIYNIIAILEGYAVEILAKYLAQKDIKKLIIMQNEL